MTLTITQSRALRELIRLLTNASDGHSDQLLHFCDTQQENDIVKLAWELEPLT